MTHGLLCLCAGEALLSPLVQCGPKGLRFLQPVELRIPHDGGSRAHSSGRWNVSLKTSNELGQWRQIELPQRGDDDHQQRPQIQSEQSDDAKKSRNHLSVFVDHFWNKKATRSSSFFLSFLSLCVSLVFRSPYYQSFLLSLYKKTKQW